MELRISTKSGWKCAKPNLLGRLGTKVSNWDFFGVTMAGCIGLIVSIFSIGMPLDLLIFAETPHIVAGLLVMLPSVLFWMGYSLIFISLFYAQHTARAAWSVVDFENVESIWRELRGAERQLISGLRKTILDNSGSKEICRPRYERIEKIYNELVAAKTKVSVDNSDLHEADALLELMSERRG